MEPGPSNVHPRITEALARPTIGHLDPEFIRMMDELKTLLQYAFQTGNRLTLPVSAPGSAGMEACFTNLVEEEDKIIVCINCVLGGRVQQNIERLGGTAILVESALKRHPDARILAFVHTETSTGARFDARTLCKLAKKYDCLTLVDALTSLTGSELRVDERGIDAVHSGSQKYLSCVSGLSPVSCNEAALKR
ncbi:MAG: pyridoxal-phosphate-dependent aminotransferase family protein [Endozoicomonas sp.]